MNCLGDIYLEESNEELALKYYMEAKEIAEFISPNNKQVCRQICKKNWRLLCCIERLREICLLLPRVFLSKKRTVNSY